MSADVPHILVVDDDRRLRQLLQKYLMDHGFLVSTAENAAEAEAKLKSLTFDLMTVDVMMPGEDGISFTKRVRERVGVPVIMLTARGHRDDRIAGLEVGADDYLSKPFDPRELMLRIKSILRRSEAARAETTVAHFGPFTFDSERMELLREGVRIPLTTREAQLLEVFARNPGITISRERLSERSGAGARTIDVQVTRLRRKIEADARNPRFLQTVRGEGYVLLTREWR